MQQGVKSVCVTNMTAVVPANEATMEADVINCVPQSAVITNALLRMGHARALKDILVTVVKRNAMWRVKTAPTTPSVHHVLLVDTDRGVHKCVCVMAVHVISRPDSVNAPHVRRAIAARANVPDARTPANMEIFANINVVTDVLISHVTLHQESGMRVIMVTLVYIVTIRVINHAHKVDAKGTLGGVMNV